MEVRFALEEFVLDEQEEEEQQLIARQLFNNTSHILSQPSSLSHQATQVITDTGIRVMGIAEAFARTYMPDLKQDMCDSALTGDAWIHECLVSANKDKMPETFEMMEEVFEELLDELGLEEGAR